MVAKLKYGTQKVSREIDLSILFQYKNWRIFCLVNASSKNERPGFIFLVIFDSVYKSVKCLPISVDFHLTNLTMLFRT